MHYIHLETVDSTNNWTKLHHSELEDFTCVTAHEQTSGRGRFQRKWLSPPGQNIYATLYFKVPPSAPYLSHLGQLMAYSCAQILREKDFPAQLKWPNDILVHHKKIAGILTETLDQTHVILGFGINVNMPPEILQTIDQPATSLLDLSGKTWDLQPLLQLLLHRFLQNLKLLQTEGFPHFHAAYEELLIKKSTPSSTGCGRIVDNDCFAWLQKG